MIIIKFKWISIIYVNEYLSADIEPHYYNDIAVDWMYSYDVTYIRTTGNKVLRIELS